LITENIRIKIYRTVILSVLYWCETWAFTLREELRLMVFDKSALRKIFGPKADGVTGEWRKLYEELYYLYSSPIVISVIRSRIRWAGHVERMGRGEVHAGFWCGYLVERDRLEHLHVDGRIILKWTGLIWLKIRTVGGPL
jgi:hypothetical protein